MVTGLLTSKQRNSKSERHRKSAIGRYVADHPTMWKEKSGITPRNDKALELWADRKYISKMSHVFRRQKTPSL
jgi:hypothetical protein